jgi:hypothetical protein
MSIFFVFLHFLHYGSQVNGEGGMSSKQKSIEGGEGGGS